MCCRSEAVQRPNFPKLEESGKNGCLPIFFAIGIITMLGSVFILLSSYKVLPYEINAINDLGVKGLLLGYTGCAVGLLVAGVSLSKWCAKESFSQPESLSSETNIEKTVKIFNFDVNLQQLEEKNTSFSEFPHFVEGKALIIGHYNKNFMEMQKEEFREWKKIVTDNKKIYNFDRILLEQLKKNCKERINIFKVDTLAKFERIKIEIQIRSSFVESQSEVGILEGKALINFSKEDIAKENLDSALVVIKKHAINEIDKCFHANCRLPAHVQIAFIVTKQINHTEEQDTTLINVKWTNEVDVDLSVPPTSKIY